MGVPKQEYWSGLLFPSAGDLPNPGIKPRSAALQADSLLSEIPGKPGFVNLLSLTRLKSTSLSAKEALNLFIVILSSQSSLPCIISSLPSNFKIFHYLKIFFLPLFYMDAKHWLIACVCVCTCVSVCVCSFQPGHIWARVGFSTFTHQPCPCP